MSTRAEMEVRLAEIDIELERTAEIRKQVMAELNAKISDLRVEHAMLRKLVERADLEPHRWWQRRCADTFAIVVRCKGGLGHGGKHYNDEENLVWR